MLRLFIALPLEAPAEEALGKIIQDLRPQGGRISWVAPKNIHLTLKFLGDTEEGMVPDIKGQLDKFSLNYHPIECSIAHLGAFPNLQRPRVIWAGIEKEQETLIQMADEMDLRMNKLGWETENKKFRAHFTLGRIREPKGVGQLTEYVKRYKFSEIPFKFDRVVLFKSTLTPQGAIYERLHKVMLGRESSSEEFSG
ncbi:MAG TPA: RNA 2',3'-cyclic phosphodiesterase [candidate division Zixibacteria bacterium]|nr:RNA 2',3'-cyclic phosphodiesterase [candidate division Zixibacteria bacterium]